MIDLVEAGRLVVDVVTGFVGERALAPALEPAWRALVSVVLPLYDPALASVRLNLQEHMERERAKDQEFTSRLERSLQRGEAGALVALFVREAAQATTQERMRMLAAAAAGVFVPDLDSDMRSRVARAVAQLEPPDVGLLRDMGLPFSRFPSHPKRFLDRLALSQAALEAAGCISLESQKLGEALADAARRNATPELRTRAHVTEVGRAVLSALTEWKSGS